MAFLNKVVLSAVRRLPVHIFTARTGLTCVDRDVDRTYPIVQRDYASFAANFTVVLADVDLRQACGINCVRFYICRHSLRLEKLLAKTLCRSSLTICFRDLLMEKHVFWL